MSIDDELERKELAISYVNLIDDLEGKQVIALDAPCGSGKTTFIDFMCEKFDEKKDIYVKFNAWENDYTNAPLISLMSDIFKEFENKKYIGIDKMKNQISKISNMGKKGISALSKGATRIVLGESGSNDAIEAIKEAGKIFVEDTVNNLFKEIDESKKSRLQFKKELKKYTKQILIEKEKNKLIIIIDELDRCKPTFAIELLENIKHLFDLEQIIFFIAVDKEQLAESIKSVYGQGFDAYTYLHRFFDLELHLPKKNLINLFEKTINSKFGNTSDYQRIANNDFLLDAINLFALTIRDFQRITTEAFLLKKLKKFEETVDSIKTGIMLEIQETEISIFLLILRHKEPDIYDIIFENNSLTIDKILDKVFEVRNSQNVTDYIERNLKKFMTELYRGTYITPQFTLNEKTKRILSMIENIF